MASLTTPVFQSQLIFSKQSHPNFTASLCNHNRLQSTLLPQTSHLRLGAGASRLRRVVVVFATAAAEKPKKKYPGEGKGFVEEMRFVAMKLHTKEQAREGEKEVKEPEERLMAYDSSQVFLLWFD